MTSGQHTNWGRWGADDQIGALNLVTPELTLHAANLIRTGKVYNLAVPLGRGERMYPGFHETWRVTYLNQRGSAGAADDVVVLISHAGTHIDGLSHAWRDGTLWNGRSVEMMTPMEGATWAGIEHVRSMATRCVMADIARFRGAEHLTPEDAISTKELQACLTAQNVVIRSGDVLLVRTGWHNVFETDRTAWESGEPGLHAATVEWLNTVGVVAVGADNPGVEWIPNRSHRLELHNRAIRDYGIYLIENLDLEALSTDHVYEAFFVTAPLPLLHGTGAPCVPLAII